VVVLVEHVVGERGVEVAGREADAGVATGVGVVGLAHVGGLCDWGENAGDDPGIGFRVTVDGRTCV
jgi:hypothetical protein